jgi:hypothetical protein
VPRLRLDRLLNQDVTWWSATRHGQQLVFAAPVKLRGRWEDVGELFINSGGTEQLSSAVAYLLQDVKLDDYLGVGDLTAHASPIGVVGCYRVMKFSKTPTVKADAFERKAYM